MFRKALLALALLFASAPAFAQNTTCADKLQTDSSNACANTRFVQSHTNTVVVPISAYGAKCDNSTDDTTSIQNAWNAAAAIGSNVWLGGVGIGICRISSLIMPTPTGTGKASFLTGPGSGSVQLSSSVTGTTCAITSTVTYGTNSYIEGAFSGFELAQRNQTQTGYGFCANNWTKGNFVDVKFSWFFRGFSGIDVTSIGFLNSTFLDNQIGAYGAMFVNTPPNDWSFIDNKFQSNGKNAISLTGPNLANISFNEFQAGGYNSGQAPTATIDIIGPPGGPVVGANIINNYFEGNDGSAEIRINQNAVANAVGVYNINNNTIVRTLSTQAAGILIVNSGTGTAKTTVNVGGNGFYDNTGVAGGFLWLSASTAGTTNYIFNCTGSNRADIAAEMPTLCQNNVANTVPMVDANAQYIGYGTKLQLTALINVATASLSGAVPAWPNNTTTFFRGDGTYATPTAGSISGGLPLTETNDTNVTMTLGGTPATALLQSVSMTLGWTGTLAAARLNANVVQAITNDTNINGSIAAQNLTLAWAGTLANARLATMATNTIKGNATSGTASPTDLAIGTCSTASSALIWTTNTGFGCNTAVTASAATTTTITDDTTTNATMDITWVTSNTGNLPQKVSSTKLNFNPSTGTLSSPLGSFSTSVTSPIHGAASALSFQINGGTVAGTIASTGQWALGTNVPVASTIPLLDVNASAAATAFPTVGTLTPTARFMAANGTATLIAMQNYGLQNIFQMYAAAGTAASPTALGTGAGIFNFQGWPYDGTNYGNSGLSQAAMAMQFLTAEAQTGTNHGTKIVFSTTPLTTISKADVMTIGPSGVNIGGTLATLAASELGMNKITASGTAPSAGTVKMAWVAGTNAGSCKMIAYGGTSTTPVTIVDNVGAGC